MKTKLAVFMMMTAACYAQSKPEATGDAMVTVPQKYVSQEGLTHQEANKASEWIGIGREIGIATREGLSSVVDVSEKFGSTNVGRFVMIMVAWKIIGKDAVGICLGIPIWFFGVWLWSWSMRKFFFGQRILVANNKTTKTKTWEQSKPYGFTSDESRGCASAIHALAISAWCIGLAVVVF